ncbi:MAG: nucleotide sugar dehydrogenase, partial [Desulfovibrionales bacterium]
FDIDQRKVDMLQTGQRYIKHIDPGPLKQAVDSRRFLPTTDFSRAGTADVLLLCVPTPLSKYREPDLSYVLDSMEEILPFLRKGQLLILESTTYPGTTEEELQARLEGKGFTIGKDVFLVYSPEREDPGNRHFGTKSIPKVVGGTTLSCSEVGEALYSKVVDQVVPVSSTKVAEMTKILENAFRAVNIALVNELKRVCDPMGIDIFEVIDAAATKPFGYMPFYPGPGLGGHCIPIDPFYLTWKAREYGVTTRFIELAGEVNTSMPDYVIEKIGLALNSQGRPILGAKVLILGVSYKPDVDDTRESPALEIMDKLRSLGAEISYSDPHVPILKKFRKFEFDLASVPLDGNLANFDCIVIVTAHKDFDWDRIYRESKTIVDTRGTYQFDSEKIWRS